MNARDAVGKRITKVEQVRLNAHRHSRMVTVLERIILEDGTVLKPVTHETEHGEYWTELVCWKPSSTTRKKHDKRRISK